MSTPAAWSAPQSWVPKWISKNEAWYPCSPSSSQDGQLEPPSLIVTPGTPNKRAHEWRPKKISRSTKLNCTTSKKISAEKLHLKKATENLERMWRMRLEKYCLALFFAARSSCPSRLLGKAFSSLSELQFPRRKKLRDLLTWPQNMGISREIHFL